jgi:hypothetical protein
MINDSDKIKIRRMFERNGISDTFTRPCAYKCKATVGPVFGPFVSKEKKLCECKSGGDRERE